MVSTQASAEATLDLLVALSLASLLPEGRVHLYAYALARELRQGELAASQRL